MAFPDYAYREITNESLEKLAELEGCECGSEWDTLIQIRDSDYSDDALRDDLTKVMERLLERIKKEYVIELEKYDDLEWQECSLLLREDTDGYVEIV